MPIEYESGKYGNQAILIGEFRPEMLAEFKKNNITELYLNTAKGWKPTDLSFLEDCEDLVGLYLVGLIPERYANLNFDKIHCLSKLKYLRTEANYLKEEIRFEAFPDLEETSIEWRPKVKSVFHSVKLKELFINHYKGRDLSAFSSLTNLEELSLLNSPLESLNGIEKLTKLKKIRFGNLKKLTTVSELASLTNLEQLWIEGSRKIQSIDAVANLINLKVLNFSESGNIETIKPIAKLNKLERIIFSGSTNIVDGDLTPLLNRPNIVIALPRRKHYFPI
jgi:BspA type Leucine rich repeat region (6 copies)